METVTNTGVVVY